MIDFKWPEKLSARIRLGVADLKKCVIDPCYVVNMGVFYDNIDTGCEVCFGGAVFAQSCGAGPDYRGLDEDAPPELYNQHLDDMDTMDSLRCGVVEGLLVEMGHDVEVVDGKFNRIIRQFDKAGPAEFYEDMEKLAADLEEAGF